MHIYETALSTHNNQGPDDEGLCTAAARSRAVAEKVTGYRVQTRVVPGADTPGSSGDAAAPGADSKWKTVLELPATECKGELKRLW